MEPPPRPPGPQLSPDGYYWWDGMRWVPVAQPQWTPPAYQFPGPSPGLRPFLIVVLVLADVVTGLFAVFGLLALADGLGLLGHGRQQVDTGSMVLMALFVGLFAVMLAATVGVAR